MVEQGTDIPPELGALYEGAGFDQFVALEAVRVTALRMGKPLTPEEFAVNLRLLANVYVGMADWQSGLDVEGVYRKQAQDCLELAEKAAELIGGAVDDGSMGS